ncbi:hypothetical protein [Streptomyces sp. NBC_00467]|uniref:hypothetical protein n=1 Tax=Streptomyces sp. NBC_00467 TaxID=2975752 RepID=UPI002E16F4E2
MLETIKERTVEQRGGPSSVLARRDAFGLSRSMGAAEKVFIGLAEVFDAGRGRRDAPRTTLNQTGAALSAKGITGRPSTSVRIL